MHLYLAALVALPVLGLARRDTLGCYSEIKGIESVLHFPYQSHGYCLQQCDKYDYAVLTMGAKCLCTNVAPSESAKVDDSKCNLICSGWPEDKCGGRDAYAFLSTHQSYSSSSNSPLLSDLDSLNGSSSDPTSDSSNWSPSTAVTAASTAGGGIIVAAHPSTMPTSMATSTRSNPKATSITKASSAAAATTTAGSSASSASPSPSDNAAGTLRAGPAAGIVLAGLGLLL